MPLLNIIVLSAVQGITEFLPVSSSAHLVLVPIFTGWPDQGLIIDVAVHVGTLLAVVIYFRRDVWGMIAATGRQFRPGRRRRRGGDEFRIAMLVVAATVPAVAAGWAINEFNQDIFRGLEIIAWATVGFAILLYLADKLSLTIKRLDHLGFAGALFIGLFQALALIPGTSRTGITITAARILGMERIEAARFSMLLSIPIIIAAGSLKGWELYQVGDVQLTNTVFTAIAISFAFAIVTIAGFMAWLRHSGFTPFVIYRLILGVFLLWVAYVAPGFTF
ncbi:MAG: undecaprenyl-diphosphate phosphatase [Rhodospirillales bacterium]|nr:undecaprenyl-diphosphate phosphatase [Rhodospirillales bacterium]